MSGPMSALVRVTDLTVSFDNQHASAVDALSFEVQSGECVALVGESGSGKSLTGRALLGMLPPNAQVSGRVQFRDATAPAQHATAWQSIRGAQVSLVPQDALGSLDPLRRVEHEVGDALRLHRLAPRRERQQRVVNALAAAGMPSPESQLRRRSDELSGGLRQRALIASALIADPELIVADEPTTALDAAHRARVLAELRQRVDDGAGLLLISHDLVSVRDLADRVLVMRNGQVVEQGATARILTAPQHEFTRALVAASLAGKTRIRHHHIDRTPPPLLELRNIAASYRTPSRTHEVLQHIALTVRRRETVGLVGESGSGKTTLLRVVLGLHAPSAGQVRVRGTNRAAVGRRAQRALNRQLAFVPQDPLDSFPPGVTAGALLTDALRAAGVPHAARRTAARSLADEMELAADLLHRPVWALSGGQRQRLAIARALAKSPALLVLDEPVSALDLTIQATVLDLLNRVQQQRGTAYLLVSHDDEVISYMSDRVLRLSGGRVTEAE